MGKIKIIFDEEACVGSGQCEVISGDLWKVKSGKAILKGAKDMGDGTFELVLDESALKKQKEVAGNCPSGAIKVEKA